MGQAPVVYGQSSRPPRGDYSRAQEDYTCAQNFAAYTAADHDTYHRLYQRQSAQLQGLASEASSRPCRCWAPRNASRASMT